MLCTYIILHEVHTKSIAGGEFSSFFQKEKEQKVEKKLTKTYVVVLLAMVCCMLWGSAFPVIKLGYAEFCIDGGDTASQILFAGCRFFLAGVLAWIFGSIAEKKPLLPKKRSIKKIALLALFQTVLQYMFFYMGLAHCSGVKSSVIDGTSAFVCVLLSALVFRMEKLTHAKVIGCVLGVAGIVVVNLGGELGGGFALNGEGFIIISMLSYAMSTILIRRFTADGDDPVMLSAIQFVVGGVFMTAAGLLLGGRLTVLTPAGAGLLLYLGALSAVAYSLWSLLLKYNPVSKVAVFGFMTPICGVLLSALFLGETKQAFSINALAALLLVCSGIYIVNRKQKNES